MQNKSPHEISTRDAEALALLPEPDKTLDRKGTHFFSSEDLDLMKEFQTRIYYGMMAEFCRTRWGKRAELFNKN
jgi:hypothetical protein